MYAFNWLKIVSSFIISIALSTLAYNQTGQFKLIDKTFTWDENTGGDGCKGYHFWEDLGDAVSTNWKTPYDYQNGLFYFRYEVISQPQLSGGGYQPFELSFCIWADRGFEPGKWKENCSSRTGVFNGPGSVITRSETPATWWAKEWGGIDWTRMDKLWRFGNPFWYNTSYLLASSGCTNAPPEIWTNERSKFFPMQLRISIVAVAQGETFLGWDHYLNGGSVLRQPTPQYSIDYNNERTNKGIPSTHEYSVNASMSPAVSGNGSTLTITPGSSLYFREKANGDTLASFIQQLSAPARPAAPTFSWNQANQRTSVVVSNAYEYSSASNMSAAVSGTGTYVSIPAGSTVYFRKKATASAFKSQVQTLQGIVNTSIGPEFVILNQEIDYPNSTDNNGFYFFPHNSAMPVNWLTPYDYFNGQIYTRYEIISQVTSTPIGLQFGIWQRLPVGSTNEADLLESMAVVQTLNGPGSVVTANSSPSTYWNYHNGVDYTQMNNVWHFGINPWKLSPNLQIRQENAAVWASRNTYWFPMKVKVTVVAVASGYTFSGWQNYTVTGTAPNYHIDFSGELTAENVESTDEYSTNQLSWTTGSNSKISLVPGQTVYIRKKSTPGLIQEINVPVRPEAPVFTIDYIHEQTANTLGSAYEYSTNSDMSAANTGSGQAVALVPGSPMYFRTKATALEFCSNIQMLSVPARPTGPVLSINYIAEKTAENIPTDVEYSATFDFAAKIAGTGTPIALTPGTPVYFRKLASPSNFLSSVFTLNVPGRHEIPAFGINYAYERTSSIVSNDYEYSLNADMSSAITGPGTSLIVTPGTDIYFIKKASGSGFRSALQHLAVPVRPAAPEFTIDYIQEKTYENIPNTVHYANNPNFSSAHEGTGNLVRLTPGTDIYFRHKASEAEFSSSVQMLDVPERPVVTLQMSDPTVESPILFDIQFPYAITGFDDSDLLISNGTVESINGSLTTGVTPLAKGIITLVVKANSVEPPNFASQQVSVTYNGVTTAVREIESDAIMVYPTIASTHITITGVNLEGHSYQVISLLGSTVISGDIEKNKCEIDISHLTPGMYHLIVRVNRLTRSFSFVKQNH